MEPLLSVRQLAAALNVSTAWVHRAAQAGKIPHVRAGNLLRFERAAVLKALSARTAAK